MKKLNKIKLGLIIFAMIIAIGIPNIKAEEATNPNSFKDEEAGVEYTINGFEIRIYDASEDEEGNSVLLENFTNRVPVRTITIEPSKYTINPETKKDTVDNIPTTLVDLNLSTTKEEIEQAIKSVIPALTTDTEEYYIELVVNYTFTTLPPEYTYYYKYNNMDVLFGIFFAELQGIEYNLPQITLNTPTSQVINYITYEKQDGEDVINYETEITEDNGLSEILKNYAIFSKKEVKFEVTDEPADTEGLYGYMFYNVDNIELLIEDSKVDPPEEDEETEEEPKNPEDIIDEMLNPTKPEDPKKEQIVKVDDTSATISGLVYFISIIIISIGGTIIYKETKRKEIES